MQDPVLQAIAQQQQPLNASAQNGQQPQSPSPIQQAQSQLQQNQQNISQEQAATKAKNALMSTPSNSTSNAAKAMALLQPESKSTITQVGKAIQTPAYAGYCLQYVDDKTGNSQRQPTAYADYQANQAAGNIDTSMKDIPKGARVYFAPNATNGGMGHVGLSNGDGSFTSATDNGVQTFNIKDWEQYADQQFIGYAPPGST